MIIEELINQKAEVAITLHDGTMRKGIITRQDAVVIELEARDGYYVIPFNAILQLYYSPK